MSTHPSSNPPPVWNVPVLIENIGILRRERDEARQVARRLYDKSRTLAQLADVNAQMAFRVMRERDELKVQLAELRRELEAMRQPPASAEE